MYLYSLRLKKDVYVAKIESDPDAPVASLDAIVWTKETGWKRVALRWLEPPRGERKEC